MGFLGETYDDGSFKESCIVELEGAHVDSRGYIQMLLNIPTHNVSLITSEKDTVRSNHYHLKDWHYIYVIDGAFDYYFREHDSGSKLKKFQCNTGDLLWTPPMEDHATVFLEASVILALSHLPRDQASYEADVRRINIIDPETLLPTV